MRTSRLGLCSRRLALGAAGALLLLACARQTARVPERPSAAESRLQAAARPAVRERQPSNVLGFEGASWLERPGRAEAEKPEEVLKAMALKPGDVVAEVGAGTGFFTRRMAPLVAPGGRVYAEDIQPEMLTLLRQYAERDGVAGNVVTVLGSDDDPRLPKGAVDWILLVDVYHEFQKPEAMLARMREALSPRGRIALVEYRAEGESAAHIHPPHRMSVEQVLAEWLPAGFELVERNETLPSQHLFIFRSAMLRSSNPLHP